MILFHATKLEFLPSIRAQGLVPHVPGVVWDNSDPDVAAMTGGKPVVWLTADKNEWRHDRHPEVIGYNAECRMLTVRLESNSKRLARYAPWLYEHDPEGYERMRMRFMMYVADRRGPSQNIEAWHVYFGTISQNKIDGLEMEKQHDQILWLRLIQQREHCLKAHRVGVNLLRQNSQPCLTLGYVPGALARLGVIREPRTPVNLVEIKRRQRHAPLLCRSQIRKSRVFNFAQTRPATRGHISRHRGGPGEDHGKAEE